MELLRAVRPKAKAARLVQNAGGRSEAFAVLDLAVSSTTRKRLILWRAWYEGLELGVVATAAAVAAASDVVAAYAGYTYVAIIVIITSGVGGGGGGGGEKPGCGFKSAGSRTRSHIFFGFTALKTIRSRLLNYGNYHDQVCDN